MQTYEIYIQTYIFFLLQASVFAQVQSAHKIYIYVSKVYLPVKLSYNIIIKMTLRLLEIISFDIFLDPFLVHWYDSDIMPTLEHIENDT